MGVQFPSLDGLLAPHLGLFWERVRSDYPNCKENVPLGQQFEGFDDGASPEVSLSIGALPPLPRIFFEDKTGQWLIQLQRDRFIHNWRVAGLAPYPRYASVKSMFLSRWNDFSQFCEQHALGSVQVNQLELTYLNHIIPWKDGQDIGDVFPDFRWKGSVPKVPAPDVCRVNCSFTDAKNKRRLRTKISPARNAKGEAILVFELSVRGFPVVATNDWFDDAREWIVTTFTTMTSPEWHVRWGRIE